ncbi:MAG: type II toxin-antitoxin system RelE/ParE family toxin [Actinomycetales bacterium]|nr:type II toxin-antitoxin system RelE/ParE family toxin [Actinomycetales bacterium]
MPSAIPWEFYLSDIGRPLFERELGGLRLNLTEAEKLKKAMERVSDSSSSPLEVKSLGRGIWELRVRIDHRIARVLFSPQLVGSCNLALFTGIKKTQKTPPSWLDIAIDRRKHWLLRQISV